MDGRPTVSDVFSVDGDDEQLLSEMRLVPLTSDRITEGDAYPLAERITLGRAEGADVRVIDPAASRLHCEIFIDHGNARIRDLGSHNGTIVDGVRVLDAFLRPGSIIEIGQKKLRFEVGKGRVKIPLHREQRFGKLNGHSTVMRRIFAQIERAAKTDATVLLIGETGTGKEVVAESIVEASSRRDGPCVVVDCGAMPAALLESELFGHEKGAFTSAASSRVGAFEAAHGGTIFLDEIGELPLELQPKLLRVLAKREVKRIGRTDYRPVDVRVIAATNRDLREEVDRNTFRSDLFYRLAIVEVRLPPLRERLEDLDVLVPTILADIDIECDPSVKAQLQSRESIARMKRHRWPGNVRELRNYLERSLVAGSAVALDDAKARERAVQSAETAAPVAQASAPTVNAKLSLRTAREEWTTAFEKRYLEELLALHEGNVRAAAKAAGVDRVHLYRMLWKHGLR